MKIEFHPYLVGQHGDLWASLDFKNWTGEETALTYFTFSHPEGRRKREVSLSVQPWESALGYPDDLIRDLPSGSKNRLSLMAVHDGHLTVYQNNVVQDATQISTLGGFLGQETTGLPAIPTISPYHAYVGQDKCRYLLRDHWRALQLICMGIYHRHGEITHIEDCSPQTGQCKNHPEGHSGGKYADVPYHVNPQAVYDFTWMVWSAFPQAGINMHSDRRKWVYDSLEPGDERDAWFQWINCTDNPLYQHHLHMHISMGDSINRGCEIGDW